MNKAELDMMKGMINVLNDIYDANNNIKKIDISDEQINARLDDLKQFEEEIEFMFSNSPSNNIIKNKIINDLKEAQYSSPVLGLRKCETIDDIACFAKDKDLVASVELGGFDMCLTYEDGVLVKVEKNSNANIKRFKNVPLKINKNGTYIVYGEFLNLENGFNFYVYDIVGGGGNSLKDNLKEAEELGFDVILNWYSENLNPKNIKKYIDYVFDYAEEEGFNCLGVTFKLNNVEYYRFIYGINNHFSNGIVYKKPKEEVYG